MWPLDLSADFLADLVNGKPSPFIGLPTPVILSHDLDSPEGLENLVNRFLEIEEEAGARSANYIVPNGWPIRHDLLQEVKQRGHEIGIHGYDHANRTPFADATERRHRLESARELIDRYNIIGYRAPSLLRTPELLQDLSRYYRYDSSVPTSGGLFPVPNNGCASARPFLLEGIAELPLSLPRDGSLRFFGYAPAELTGIWVQCTERIARSGGVVVMLTHCENRFSGSACMLDAYRKFLGYIASSKQYEWSTPLRVLQNALGKSWVHRDGR
jgi:peptidoglycan/xylan/chitin deacetylase (PgdA/CDA1 family)